MNTFSIQFNLYLEVAKAMQLNYKDIGNRIKQQRKKIGLTQEKLAELTEISVPHMSNIENANTKVSLTVLVNIANVLHCTIDELLCGNLANNAPATNTVINNIFDGCTKDDKAIILDIMEALKISLQEHKE